MVQLNEVKRQELLNKSKSAEKVKSYGTTRYDRKEKQHVFTSISVFNKIDFNALFRANLLSFILPIHGEHGDYLVEILFEGICDDIKREIKSNKNKLEFKCVYRALIDAINRQDILITCNCPDQTYRFQYWASKNGYNGGKPETRPPKITNPEDKQGAGCKHILKVLSNLDWAIKLATSVYNYIRYMEKNETPKFVKVIFPTLFDISYKEYSNKDTLYAVGDKELANPIDKESDKEIVDQANKLGEYNPESEEPEEGE